MSRKPLDQDLYDSVVEEAKRKFAVWPSAYASGWVVKTYKDRGGRYGGESKGARTGLTKWFGESWVDLSRPIREGGEVVGYEPCGRKKSDDPADYPKCRPAREAMRMTPEEVRDAVRRKRRAEASAGERGSRARAPVRVATYKQNPAPDTEAFRRWFGDSKVVDENGEPLVVYHGAPDVRGIFAGGFKRSAMRGDVFFATDDPRTAETYTDPHRAWDYQNAEPGVIPLYLRIENPLVVDADFQHWRGTESVIEKARQAGHDGVIIENTIDHYASDRKAKPRREDACTVFAFFSPTQAKSALTEPMKARDPNRWHVSTAQPLDFTGPNDGTFDLDDADLRSNPMRQPEDAPGFRLAAIVHTPERIILAAYTDDGQMLAWIAARAEFLLDERAKRRGVRRAAFPDLSTADEPGNVVWAVEGVDAFVDGWGPFIYEMLLTFVAEEGYSGWVAADTMSTSGEADRVWQRFAERDDVEFLDNVGRNARGEAIPAMRARDALLALRAPLLAHLDTRPEYLRAVRQFQGFRDERLDVRENPRLYEYQGEHLPPGPDDGAPMHDVDNMMPDYCAHPEWYATGAAGRDDAEAASIICAVRGRPWAPVWVYRAVPPGVKDINPGDWVTQVRAYAKEHLESNLGGVGRILKTKARAGSLFTEGNSHFEWGWWPDEEREREFQRLLRAKRAATVG